MNCTETLRSNRLKYYIDLVDAYVMHAENQKYTIIKLKITIKAKRVGQVVFRVETRGPEVRSGASARARTEPL